MRRFTFTALLVGSTLAFSPIATADVGSKARELARLRAEVEELSSRLREQQAAAERELGLIDSRRAMVESELQQEVLRTEQLSVAKRDLESTIADARTKEATLKTAVEDSIKALTAHVQQGLPFMRSERVSGLQELLSAMNDGSLLPSAAAARLWSRLEDEIRLSRESGLHRQVVNVGEQELLCDVARLGMVALYFRTPDGGFGQAAQRDGVWSFEVLADAEDQERLAPLFESLSKRQRVGFYDLPNPLHGEMIQ